MLKFCLLFLFKVESCLLKSVACECRIPIFCTSTPLLTIRVCANVLRYCRVFVFLVGQIEALSSRAALYHLRSFSLTATGVKKEKKENLCFHSCPSRSRNPRDNKLFVLFFSKEKIWLSRVLVP